MNSAFRYVLQGLVVIMVVAVVARVAYSLLMPLLPGLGLIVALGAIAAFVIRGPHAKGKK